MNRWTQLTLTRRVGVSRRGPVGPPPRGVYGGVHRGRFLSRPDGSSPCTAAHDESSQSWTERSSPGREDPAARAASRTTRTRWTLHRIWGPDVQKRVEPPVGIEPTTYSLRVN